MREHERRSASRPEGNQAQRKGAGKGAQGGTGGGPAERTELQRLRRRVAELEKSASSTNSEAGAQSEKESVGKDDGPDVGSLVQAAQAIEKQLGKDSESYASIQKEIEAARAAKDKNRPHTVQIRYASQRVDRKRKQAEAALASFEAAEKAAEAATTALATARQRREEADAALAKEEADLQQLQAVAVAAGTEGDTGTAPVFDFLAALLKRKGIDASSGLDKQSLTIQDIKDEWDTLVGAPPEAAAAASAPEPAEVEDGELDDLMGDLVGKTPLAGDKRTALRKKLNSLVKTKAKPKTKSG